MAKLHVNFVISEDKASRIFAMIFQRFLDCGELSVTISRKPIPRADVYHYHRPQMEHDLGRRSVVTVHHDLDDPDPFVRFSGFERQYRQADRIICLNTLQRDWLARRGYNHTLVIPHGYDDRLFRKRGIRARVPERKLVLGMTSKRYARRFKGETHIYDLVQRLDPDAIAFLLVGEGRAEDTFLLRSLGFEARCHEHLPYRLYPAIYEEMDLLLMASNFEGGPANIPEAVASGTPALCTPIGMVPDMIRHGVNGMMLTGDPDRDADMIAAIRANRDGLHDRLSAGAHEAVTAPTWDEVIERHVALYGEIAQDHDMGLVQIAR